MLLVYKEMAIYLNGNEKHVIPERLMALAVRRARRMGMFVRDMRA